jgi:N-acetylglucosamine-6-phosphate deacetylase
MASSSPAAFLGLTHQRGRIAVGQAADLVLLNDALQVRDTWINGAALDRLIQAENQGH